jgi:hypothetical protein
MKLWKKKRKKCKYYTEDGLCTIDCALNNGPIKCWNCHDYYAGLKGAVTAESYEKYRGDINE